MSAILGKDTNSGVDTNLIGECRIEVLNEICSDIFPYPLVEYSNEKIAPFFGCNTPLSYVPIAITFYGGRELDVMRIDIFKKLIKL